MSMFKIGQIVKHESTIWKPQGKLVIVKIETGRRSGLKIITARDDDGEKFIAVEGVFSVA